MKPNKPNTRLYSTSKRQKQKSRISFPAESPFLRNAGWQGTLIGTSSPIMNA